MTDDDRLGPPPVEPMSEAAWSRVERGVWSRLGDAPPSIERTASPSRRWWIAAPVVAAAAAAALVLALRPGAPGGGDELRIVTDAAGSSVSFADSHIEVAPYTALATSRGGGHPTVLLERGAAWFTVAPRAQGAEFVVRAGDAMVRVVGTRFRVARSDEQIAVEVERGVVDVKFRGSVVALGANQRWSSTSPAQISNLVSRAPAPPAAPVAPGEPALELPADEPPPPPRHTGKPSKRDVKPAAGADAAATPEGPPAGAPDAPDAPDALGAARTREDRERAEYERLAALEPIHPDAARDGYLALARGTSRWADLSLFAAARLAVDRHDRRAETLLRIYLQRFPSGANAADAKQLLAHLKGERP
jgi:hypothetical protein